MEYIVKITLVKEKIQGYLSIYIGKYKAIWGKKKRERDILIYMIKLYIVTIYIGKTIQNIPI